MSATIYSNSSFTDTPYGLKLQQTITATGTTSVTIPTGINRVYAIVIGGGGGGVVVLAEVVEVVITIWNIHRQGVDLSYDARIII